MELTPQLLTDEIDFRIAVRGYDRHEVDDFLERVAVAVGQLQSQLTKAVTRAKNAEGQLEELRASGGAVGTPDADIGEADQPPQVSETAPVEAPTTMVEPEPVADPLPERGPKAPPAAPVTGIADDEDLNDELRRTLVLAQRTADTAIREAHEEARSIVERADEEARRTREETAAENEQAREEARGRLVEEIQRLEEIRETLRSDTVVLERYLGTERARVRETIQVLRRLVDEPATFRPEPLPELSGVTAPQPADTAPGARDEDPLVVAETSEDDTEDSAEPGESASAPETSPEAAPDDADTAESGSATTDEASPAESSVDEGLASTPDHAGASSSTDEPMDPSATAASDDPTGTSDEVAESAEDEPAESDTTPVQPDDDAERLGQLFESADTTRDWRTTGPERGDQGPHTQPVAAARFEEESDEAFLAELRRAMSDDEPLGPTNEN